MAEAWTVTHRLSLTEPDIRTLGFADLSAALREGWRDFLAIPTQLLFLCVFYPVIGLFAARLAADAELTPLLFPMVGGFALVGPLAALGLYELSRRREAGEPVAWYHVFDVLRSPSFGAILRLGAALAGVFLLWLWMAHALHGATMGRLPPGTDFLSALFGTREGWTMILLGNLIGAGFAVAVMAATVFAFPHLLAQGGPAREAVRLSLRAVRRNPGVMLAWGAIVGGLLFLGSLPFFVGLALALPVLGHATWHLYRRAVG
jgi:uncharacterized membrane protein